MSLFQQAFSLQNDAPAEEELNDDQTVAALEEDNSEIVESLAVVESEENMITDLEERAEVAEEIEATIEQMVANGEGLDRNTALAYQQAFKGLVGSVLPNPVQSLESFGGDSQRLEATRRTQEGIADTLKKIWAAIKAAVLRAVAAIKDFFAKLFGGVESLKKRVAAVKAKIAAAKKDKLVAPSDKIKVSGGVRLHVAGKLDPASVKSGLDTASGAIADASSAVKQLAVKTYMDIAGALEGEKEAELDKLIAGAGGDASAVKSLTSVKGKPLPGGKAVVMVAEGDSEKGKFGANFYIGDAPKSDWKQSEEVDAPSIADMEAMVKSIETIVKQMEGSKKASEELGKARERAVKAGEKLIAKAQSGKLSSWFNQAKLSASLRLANVSFNRTLSSFDGYLFGVSRAATQYLDSCVSSYKKA